MMHRRSKARIYWMTLVLLLFAATGLFAQPAPQVEAGVPFRLARSRKAAIDSVFYSLSFRLADSATPVTGTAIVNFYLRFGGDNLQLDFQQDSGSVTSLVLNDAPLTNRVRAEHILLPGSGLHPGWNRASVGFRLRNPPISWRKDLAYTLLVPARARALFPCFDQPDLKARFRLSVAVPSGWSVIANAPERSTAPQGNLVQHVFDTSDRFSTYLFSFVAGKGFQVIAKPYRDLSVRLFYQDTSAASRLSHDAVLDTAIKALAFMERATGIPYPFQKLDLIDILDFQFNGMEHVGAIDLKRAAIFLPANAPIDRQIQRGSTVSHEVSHMWFGDLVTMRWFDDVWIKEVFANYMAGKITGEQGEDYELKAISQNLPNAYSSDRSAGANPMYQALGNLNDAGLMYGNIIYNKSQVFMRQLELKVGWEAMQAGLREYLTQHAGSNASWIELLRCFEKHSGQQLQAWNRQWVDTPGRPVISFELQRAGDRIGSLRLRQRGEHVPGHTLEQRFTLARVYADTIEVDTVSIGREPLNVTAASGKRIPEYILLNADGRGYGRFAVDTAMHAMLHLRSRIMRLSAYINHFENLLANTGPTAPEALEWYLDALEQDTAVINRSYLSRRIALVYWRLMSEAARNKSVNELERRLWAVYQGSGKSKTIFNLYLDIATTPAAMDTLRRQWAERDANMGGDDAIRLVCNLVLKGGAPATIFDTLQQRLGSPYAARLDALREATSSEVSVRDAFAASLKSADARRNQEVVVECLGYLHHPLRARTSIRYLEWMIDSLENIHVTGDIFFPYKWLDASLAQYQTKAALRIAEAYLAKHPGGSDRQQKLNGILLQHADFVERATALLAREGRR